jgi:hypothetical protein
MKQLFLIMVFMLGSSCKGQSPVYPIQGNGARSEEGAYYKDVDNVFNKFDGTWKYQNGNTSLTITLQKKVLYYDSEDGNYLDMLIGEYKYIENGNVVVNTLPKLMQTNLEPYQNNIAGMLIIDRNLPVDSRRVELCFKDPEREYLNRSIRIKHIAADGSSPEKIEIQWIGSMSITPNENSPTEIRVPEQNYILTKQ